MAQAVTTITRLLTVREIQENTCGATLHFQEGGHGCLTLRDANYATFLRLAQRSQERQHPLGVRFEEGHAIAELLRADNDIPTQLSEEDPDRVRVFFQGHDGVFRLNPDHPEFRRIHNLLTEAIRQQTRVWFLAQKPDLTLLDVVPVGGVAAPSSARPGSSVRGGAALGAPTAPDGAGRS